MSQQDPTANYRKYPKGPSFGTIVALFCVTILVVAAIAVFILRHHAAKMVPHGPNSTPNSLALPFLTRPSLTGHC